MQDGPRGPWWLQLLIQRPTPDYLPAALSRVGSRAISQSNSQHAFSSLLHVVYTTPRHTHTHLHYTLVSLSGTIPLGPVARATLRTTPSLLCGPLPGVPTRDTSTTWLFETDGMDPVPG